MTGSELLALYEREGALLKGHFQLRSGMHSERYLQSALLLSHPDHAGTASEAVADLLREDRPEAIVSPALGGMIVGHEVARALGVRFLFAERKEERFLLRRGFRLEPGEVVAIVEDVVTTGGSVRLVMEMIERLGGRVVSVGALVDRSEGRVRFGVPFRPAASLTVETFSPEKCPLCRRGIPLRKPGSRGTDA